MSNAVRNATGWRPTVAPVAPEPAPVPVSGVRSVTGWQSPPLPPPEPQETPRSLERCRLVNEVLDWVGTDQRRAMTALAREERGQKRPTLMRTLAVIIEEAA